MNIFDFTLNELEDYLVNNGFKKYNATQIIEWIYEKNIMDFDKMTNLSKNLISFCSINFKFILPTVVKVEKSHLANKYLLELKDSNKIECVLMNHDYGYSLCVSSQVGCNMGCSFCESGRLKKVRNLSLEELEEFLLKEGFKLVKDIEKQKFPTANIFTIKSLKDRFIGNKKILKVDGKIILSE